MKASAKSAAPTLSLRERMTWIGHQGQRYWNPISAERVDAWVAELALGPDDAALDVGCGRGELLLQAAATHGCRVLGIDPLRPAIEMARAEAMRRGLDGLADFRARRFEEVELPAGAFRLCACLGASHAFDGWRGAMTVLPELLAPGGWLLVGEGYWKQTPDQGYLDFLGCEEEVYLDHQGNLDFARECGLEVVRAHQADDAEWVAFEDGYAGNLHAFLGANPRDPDADQMMTRITAWRDAYLEWGVDTLGFGLYLLRKPD